MLPQNAHAARCKTASLLTAPPAELVDAKLLTRATYSLSGMEGPVSADKAGAFTFKERDGMDYAAITLQAPAPPFRTLLDSTRHCARFSALPCRPSREDAGSRRHTAPGRGHCVPVWRSGDRRPDSPRRVDPGSSPEASACRSSLPPRSWRPGPPPHIPVTPRTLPPP